MKELRNEYVKRSQKDYSMPAFLLLSGYFCHTDKPPRAFLRQVLWFFIPYAVMELGYTIMPWPDRIYEGTYRTSIDSKEEEHIPHFYSTQMQVMINALNNIPLSKNHVSGSQGISVMMANSLMFQRAPQTIENYDDPQLADFYGEALPLLKRGIPVSITHLENTAYPDTWKNLKLLLMSYSNMTIAFCTKKIQGANSCVL